MSAFLVSHYRPPIDGSEKLDDAEIRLPCSFMRDKCNTRSEFVTRAGLRLATPL